MKMKLRTLLLPIATIGLAATPVLVATSCATNYEHYFFTVTNDCGLEVEFCDVGASIANMKIGNTNVVYHPKDRATFINHEGKPYFHGKILGRVAGRFADGNLELGGKNYKLQVNEKSTTKNNCLHGGTDSLCFKDFTHAVEEKGDYTLVTFTYTSADGEAGFPAKLDVTAQYKVYKKENKIDTILTAVPSKKTVINLSTHSLFRLGNDGDVLDYELTIPADHRIEYEKEAIMKTNQVPAGRKSVSEDNGIYDFRYAKKIGKDIYASAFRDPVSNGYDHIWHVKDSSQVSDRYVNLYNPKNHLNLKVTALSEKVTGFILYSNDYPMKGVVMNDGKDDALYSGITIEPYTYFDSSDLSPITYDPNAEKEADRKFETSYSYEFTQVEPK